MIPKKLHTALTIGLSIVGITVVTAGLCLIEDSDRLQSRPTLGLLSIDSYESKTQAMSLEIAIAPDLLGDDLRLAVRTGRPSEPPPIRVARLDKSIDATSKTR